jgi:type I restriction enzyme S subunit
MTTKFPESWQIRKIFELNDYESMTIDPSEFKDEEFELYSVPSFPSGQPEILKGTSIGSSKQVVLPGDVLICKINPRINRVWCVGPSRLIRQIASSEWIIFRNLSLNPKFLQRYFSSPKFRELITSDLTGVGGSLTRAQPKRVETFPIPIPPISEQKCIADKLDTLLLRVDACRKHLDQVSEILKRFRQAVLSAAISGRLTKEWSNSQNCTTSWTEVTLGDVGIVTGGLTKNPKRHSYKLQKPYLRVANVYANKLDLSDIAEIGLTEEELEKTRLSIGDLLIVEGNGSLEQIGRAAIWTGDIINCVHQNHIIRWRGQSDVLPKFVLFFLLSPMGRSSLVKLSSSTSGLNTLSISKVSSIRIPLPSLDEQREIVRRVEALFAYADRLESRHQAARKQVDGLTPALLAKAFRGELVPQDPNDEPASVLLERIRIERKAKSEAIIHHGKTAKTKKASKSEGLMRKLSEVKLSHLSDILKENGSMIAERLWRASDLSIDDFYEQLKDEEAKGLLKEIRNPLNDMVSVLEAL